MYINFGSLLLLHTSNKGCSNTAFSSTAIWDIKWIIRSIAGSFFHSTKTWFTQSYKEAKNVDHSDDEEEDDLEVSIFPPPFVNLLSNLPTPITDFAEAAAVRWASVNKIWSGSIGKYRNIWG